jgi:hypothetical protein
MPGQETPSTWEDFMPTGQPDQDALFEEANRLYWESEESVNHIGESLGLSKGVLYGLLEPLPAGLPCPKCGEEMVFPNRTARDKGFLECPECGMEEEEAAVQAYWEGEADMAENEGDSALLPFRERAGDAVQSALDAGRERVANMTPKTRVIAATALLGVAAGLVLGAHFRNR